MVFMIAMAAIAIDVVVLYVIKSEAQRAADAAALAGAHQFVTSGLTSGLPVQGQICDGSGTGLAQQAAIAAALQNPVGGQPGVVLPSDAICNLSQIRNPQITVKVTRRNVPTFFSHIWNSQIINTVIATSTAEAYNESGHQVPVESSCLKPFLLPNKDPGFGGTGFVTNGDIAHPGSFPSGSIGETLTLVPAPSWGDTTQEHFYPISFLGTQRSCPAAGTDCADVPPQSDYEANIQCCNTDYFQCGALYNADNNLAPANTTSRGAQCMIHGRDSGSGADQVIFNPPVFTFNAGSHNPTGLGQGSPVATSDSLITVPLYDGTTLINPGTQTTVIGFLQLFVGSVNGSGTMTATVVNVIGCTPQNRNPVAGGGISPVPVRLVQPGGGN